MNYRNNLLPLDTVEGIVPQKCMMPGRFFPDTLWPGAWVKCILNDDQFTVCQIYPREYEKKRQTCIFLDTAVSNMEIGNGFMLERIIRFDLLMQGVAKRLDTVFVLTQRFFELHPDYSRETLRDIFYQYCSSLKFSLNCIVRLPVLHREGIDAIIIKTILDVPSDANYYVPITKAVPINILDVRVISPFMDKYYYPIAGGDLLGILSNMTTVVCTQKSVSSTFRMSLNILLTGASGTGKTSLIGEFVKENELNCFRILPTDIVSENQGDAEKKLSGLFDAVIEFEEIMRPRVPTVIFIKDLDVFCPAKGTIYDCPTNVTVGAHLCQWIDRIDKSGLGIICIATSSHPEQIHPMARQYRRFCHDVVMRELNAHDRRTLMVNFFEQSFLRIDYGFHLPQDMRREIVRSTNNYNAADMLWLLNQIGRHVLSGKLGLESAVKEALKVRPPKEASIDLQIFKPVHGFEIIGGMDTLKTTLSISILSALEHSEVYLRFGLALPKGLLFYGPPGCAKTTFAKCLAREANMSFISASSADIYSPYVGRAEKFIVNLFNTARKNAPCLIFLDEIDSLVGQRSSGSTDVQLRVLATLLVEMDGILTYDFGNCNKHILVIGATNRPDLLDSALLRPGRFDKLLHIPAPDADCRLSILSLMANNMPFVSDLDLRSIAGRTNYFSGADLCCLCNEAALLAIQRTGDTNMITMDDFSRALSKLKPSLTRNQILWYTSMEINGFFYSYTTP